MNYWWLRLRSYFGF